MPLGFAISIRVETFCIHPLNTVTPHPYTHSEGHIENVLANMPSESKLHNVHATSLKIYPRKPRGPQRLAGIKKCKNFSLSVSLQQDAPSDQAQQLCTQPYYIKTSLVINFMCLLQGYHYFN